MTTTTRFILVMMLSLMAIAVKSAVPGSMDYQGYLTDQNGAPIDGDVEITFQIYDNELATVSLWTDILDVPIDAGPDLGVPYPDTGPGRQLRWVLGKVYSGEEITEEEFEQRAAAYWPGTRAQLETFTMGLHERGEEDVYLERIAVSNDTWIVADFHDKRFGLRRPATEIADRLDRQRLVSRSDERTCEGLRRGRGIDGDEHQSTGR